MAIGQNGADSPAGVAIARIGGMTCVNRAGLVEERLKAFPQVLGAEVAYPSGRAVVTWAGEPDIAALQGALRADGCSQAPAGADHANTATERRGPRDYAEIGAAFVILVAMALGLVFLIGFVASVSSCLAVTGGAIVALLSLSVASSLAQGGFRRHFLRFAGAAQAGERQHIAMKVVGLDYRPNQFTVTQGAPVEWAIDASEAEGCGRMLMAPKLGVRKLLAADRTTLITFTPTQAGEFAFNCGMGMMTPESKITVVPAGKGRP